MSPRPYITQVEAARIVGCARSTIQRAIASGALSSYSLPTVPGVYLLRREVIRFRPKKIGRPKSLV